MATYLILNVVVLLVVGIFIALKRPSRPNWAQLAAMMVILLPLTALFDSIIINLQIVAYDGSKILGIIIGRAPIEDFAYTLLVIVLVPVLWKLYTKDTSRAS